MARLEGRVAIVTGGGSGSRRGSVLEMAKEGADIAITMLANDQAVRETILAPVPLKGAVIDALPFGARLAVGFPAGAINIVPGDGPTTGAYLVQHPDRPAVLAHCSPGEYFGELGPLLGFPRAASARAARASEVVAYSVRDFRQLVGPDGVSEVIAGRGAGKQRIARPTAH